MHCPAYCAYRIKLYLEVQLSHMTKLNNKEDVNTICYNVLKSYIATVQTCGHLQLFLVQFVQICTCFLLHCVLLYKKQLQVSHSLHNYLYDFNMLQQIVLVIVNTDRVRSTKVCIIL